MKGSIYIIIGLAFLFVALYIFAYVMMAIDQRKIKKEPKKTSKKRIYSSREPLLPKKSYEYRAHKRHRIKEKEMQG